MGLDCVSCNLTLPVQFLFVGVILGPLKNRSPACFITLFTIEMGGAAEGVGVATTQSVGIDGGNDDVYCRNLLLAFGQVGSLVRVFTSVQRRGGG